MSEAKPGGAITGLTRLGRTLLFIVAGLVVLVLLIALAVGEMVAMRLPIYPGDYSATLLVLLIVANAFLFAPVLAAFEDEATLGARVRAIPQAYVRALRNLGPVPRVVVSVVGSGVFLILVFDLLMIALAYL